LLLELYFDSRSIPDFDRNRYGGNRCREDGDLDPEIRTIEIEDIPGESAADDLSYKLQHQNADEEGHLPVVPGNRKIAPDPPIKAEVHHRRERPDVFAVRRQFTKGSSNISGCDVHRQRKPFVPKERGKRTQ